MSEAQEFSHDQEYFTWLSTHPLGYVLCWRGPKGALLHRATCSHIDRHNSPGALTERGSRKACADDKQALRDWMKRSDLGPGVVLPKCPTCGP